MRAVDARSISTQHHDEKTSTKRLHMKQCNAMIVHTLCYSCAHQLHECTLSIYCSLPTAYTAYFGSAYAAIAVSNNLLSNSRHLSFTSSSTLCLLL